MNRWERSCSSLSKVAILLLCQVMLDPSSKKSCSLKRPSALSNGNAPS